MAISNKYPGYCLVCNTYVKKGQGHPQRLNGKWAVRCHNCIGKGNKADYKQFPPVE